MSSNPPAPAPALLRRIIAADTALSLRLYTLTSPILPFSILKTLEISGDGRLFFPIIISLAVAGGGAFIFNLLISAVLDLALIGLIKHQIQRTRPVYNKNMFHSFAVDQWSFPSGHSSRVFLIATMVCLSFDSVQSPLIDLGYEIFAGNFGYIVWVWAIVTSISRVLLGRHFVLDVIAGAGLGVLEGVFVFRFLSFEYLSSLRSLNL